MQPAKFPKKLTHNHTQRLCEVWNRRLNQRQRCVSSPSQPYILQIVKNHTGTSDPFFGFPWWAAVEPSPSALQWQAVNGWIFSNVISADPCLRLFFIFTSSSVPRFHFRPDWCLIAVYYRCACLHLEKNKTKLKMVKQVPQKSDSDLSGVKEKNSDAASRRNTILSSLLSFI